MHELTQQGIAALKAGDRETARRLLAEAVDADENDATAWLWLAAALTHDADRVTCLRQVLKLDPQNQAAKRGLAQILNRPLTAPARTESAPQPTAAEAAPVPPALEDTAAPAKMAEPADTNVSTAAAAEAAPAEEASTPAPAPVAMPAPVAAAAPETAYQRRRARRDAEQAAAQPAEVIFTARPSQVPALICFWLFLVGAGVTGALLGQVPGMAEPVSLVPGSEAFSLPLNLLVGLGLFLLLELVVIYVVIRNFVARYQLTDRQLIVRFRGRRARLDLAHIFSAECHQNAFQKLTGTGDTEVEAVINGQLALVRLRNIADCARRTAQIQALI